MYIVRVWERGRQHCSTDYKEFYSLEKAVEFADAKAAELHKVHDDEGIEFDVMIFEQTNY